ncbi:short-chain dehydrogenase [Fusarium acutatum]|uniref:Short-chain dehydrogenase n=1 Tax=Fusarium acutatum TaxID=78861 RepID=A0A8H4NHJ4_9HYPO|nr:short-chain dehydrogenase [Fusarium acutatum]
MSLLAQIRASNAQLTEATTPRTAVFIGATDGIGKRALAELVSHGFPLKAYIIGRDQARDQSLLAELYTTNNQVELVYLEGQISLMSEVIRLTSYILEKEKEIDLLFHSAGFLPLLGRQETDEGLELSTAVAYFSRLAFILRLLPRLQAAVKSGHKQFSPRIISILAAGNESVDLFLNDLSLKEPGHFSVPIYARHVATMVTLAMKHLAEEPGNENIVFIHAHPGRVSTDLVRKSWGDRWDGSAPLAAAPSAMPLSQWTPEEAGEKALYLMTSAEYGGKGVNVMEGRSPGLTVTSQSGGSLFSVNDVMKTLQQDTLLAGLEAMGAPNAIWDYSVKTLAPWL